ncbi:MAG: hypothetical protein LLG45_12580 [Actinomycetia bacterium]|nr:hypothetical protein [Actinomycetes bacterium]
MINGSYHKSAVGQILADQAEALRAVRSVDELTCYPGENGPRVAEFPRSDTEKMRLNLSSYEGHYFLQYATLRKRDDGKWHVEKTQSIRLIELDLLEVVIQKVRDLTRREEESRHEDE